MKLLEALERLLAQEQSLFRAQLLREDISRLRSLLERARVTPDCDEFVRAGMTAGWTQGNARTHELREPLERLLEALHAHAQGQRDDAQQADLIACWNSLNRLRMERLLGCLSTPLPRPPD
ncbi:MAG TPA: hypothetical protein VM491_11755 [Burkholderiaceae bacterium]|nr:hypothetical protein [Burkholderiaceae bacterium]